MGNVLLENQPTKKENRIKSIVAVSENREDTLHETLQPLFDKDPDLKVKYHSNCANKCCSVKQKAKIRIHRQSGALVSQSSTSKNFVYVVELTGPSSLTQGTRNDGVNEAYIVLTIRHFYPSRNNVINYKTYLEDICDKHNDKWGQDVK